MATLETQLIALAQAVGVDIKSLSLAVSALGGGSAAASIKTALIDVPYGSVHSYVALIIDTSISPNSRVLASFGSTDDSMDNDAEDLAELSLVATSLMGALSITLSAPGAMGGAIPINYFVGN